jgi:hypothetical protein
MEAAAVVVAVVGAARLVAMDLDGQGVQVHGDLVLRAPGAQAGPVGCPGTEHLEESGAVGGLGQSGHQAGQGGLGGEAFRLPAVAPGPQGALAPALGNRQAEGRVVAQEVHVTLAAPALSSEQHRRTEQLAEGMGDEVRIPAIGEALLQKLPEPEPLAHLPQKNGPGIGRQALGRGAQLQRTVEFQRKESTLNFTHGVSPLRRNEMVVRHLQLIAA